MSRLRNGGNFYLGLNVLTFLLEFQMTTSVKREQQNALRSQNVWTPLGPMNVNARRDIKGLAKDA